MQSSRLYALAAVLVLAATGAGCGGDAGAEQVPADGATAETGGRVVNVEVLELVAETFEDRIGITGVVEADRDVTVAAEESGVIRELFVERGALVRAGQPIARVDDRVLRAQHDQAAAEAALARETYERQRRLWEEDGIGSEMNYLRAKYGAETADANVRMLAARLDRTLIRAPISGVLEQRLVEVGSMVAPGTPVARVIDIDTLKISGGVPERYAAEIRTGAGASIFFDSFGEREFTGHTRFVGSAVSEQNRTFPIEVAVANPGRALKPGMVAKVQLARGDVREAVLVPREAVLRTENGYIVYVVREHDGQRATAAAVPVLTGSGAGNRVVIESGVGAGDRIVVVGQHQVADGDAVAITAAGGAR